MKTTKTKPKPYKNATIRWIETLNVHERKMLRWNLYRSMASLHGIDYTEPPPLPPRESP